MASPDTNSDVLDWVVPLAQVPGTGKRVSFSATAAERAAFASAAGLEACDDLAADLSIEPLAGGSYRVRGHVSAKITQACVVTLEPVPARLDEQLLVDFRADFDQAMKCRHEVDLDEEADIEPIDTAGLLVGRIIYESLVSAIDPYPRKPDAALPEASGQGDLGKTNPFAVLAQLKSKIPGPND
jgi:uncharacterized metal-binding protein YceD (DUF177 family)